MAIKIEKLNDRTIGQCRDLTTTFVTMKKQMREQGIDGQRERFKPRAQLL